MNTEQRAALVAIARGANEAGKVQRALGWSLAFWRIVRDELVANGYVIAGQGSRSLALTDAGLLALGEPAAPTVGDEFAEVRARRRGRMAAEAR